MRNRASELGGGKIAPRQQRPGAGVPSHAPAEHPIESVEERAGRDRQPNDDQNGFAHPIENEDDGDCPEESERESSYKEDEYPRQHERHERARDPLSQL